MNGCKDAEEALLKQLQVALRNTQRHSTCSRLVAWRRSDFLEERHARTGIVLRMFCRRPNKIYSIPARRCYRCKIYIVNLEKRRSDFVLDRQTMLYLIDSIISGRETLVTRVLSQVSSSDLICCLRLVIQPAIRGPNFQVDLSLL